MRGTGQRFEDARTRLVAAWWRWRGPCCWCKDGFFLVILVAAAALKAHADLSHEKLLGRVLMLPSSHGSRSELWLPLPRAMLNDALTPGNLQIAVDVAASQIPFSQNL